VVAPSCETVPLGVLVLTCLSLSCSYEHCVLLLLLLLLLLLPPVYAFDGRSCWIGAACKPRTKAAALWFSRVIAWATLSP
jgi:hypothetical protein